MRFKRAVAGIAAIGIFMSYAPSLHALPGQTDYSEQEQKLEKIIGKEILDFINKDGIGEKDFYKPEHAIYALSNIVEGLYFIADKDPVYVDESGRLIGMTIKKTLSISPVNLNGKLGEYGRYLSNLNLQLGYYKMLIGSDEYAELNRRITEHLTKGSLGDRTSHFPYAPGNDERYPGSQAMLLYSIKQFDDNYGTEYAKKPIDKWLSYVEQNAIDSKTGLPILAINTDDKALSTPRGSSLSYMIKYTAYLDRDKAESWWDKYKLHFLTNIVWYNGFMEFCQGDFSDSHGGPVIMGIGTSATAMGIGTANTMGDPILAVEFYDMVETGISIAVAISKNIKRSANDISARSVLFSGLNAPEVK